MVKKLTKENLFQTLVRIEGSITSEESSVERAKIEIEKSKSLIKERKELLKLAKSSKSYFSFFTKIINLKD